MVRSLFAKLQRTIYLDFDQKMANEILLRIIEELYKASHIIIACVSVVEATWDCGQIWASLRIQNKNVYMFADAPNLLKLFPNWLIDTGEFYLCSVSSTCYWPIFFHV